MLDRYSKLVLTVIALGLVGVNIKLWEPQSAYADSKPRAVTMATLLNSPNMTDAERAALLDEIPVVAVWSILNK
jgi:hypothetical protein